MISVKMRDYSGLRKKMIERHIIARGVKSKKIIKVMGSIPRHLFVDEALQDQAYNDNPLPIGEGQTISQPFIVALMVEALELKGDEKVLEIGTGSGYETAVLCSLSDKVYSIERCPILASKARKILDKLNFYNALLRVDDGTLGWKDEAPFDAIIVSASSPEIPEPLVKQLCPGGRLVIPIGGQMSQELIRIVNKDGRMEEENLGACRFVKLIGDYGWKE